jgi:hypothetical protein
VEAFDGHHIVMADPEGNEFCVAAASAARQRLDKGTVAPG